MNKKKIYFWACDYSLMTGEGRLAHLFVKKLNVDNKTTRITNYNLKIYKYISPFVGIIFCWWYFLRNKRVCYINYLPLWNFFVFMLLPPKTIIGPITGGAIYSQNKDMNFLIRSKIFPIFFKISQIFLKIRNYEIIFSTSLLKRHLNKKILEKSKFNFVLENIKIKKKIKKKYDLLIYFRKHKNKNFEFPYKFIKSLVNKKFKIVIVGDILNINNVKNLGKINNNLINKVQSLSNYTIASNENIYSLFITECISNNVKILVSKENKKNINFFKDKFMLINFNNLREILKLKKLKRNNIKN